VPWSGKETESGPLLAELPESAAPLSELLEQRVADALLPVCPLIS
jgi:hypothetical protein